MTGPNDPRLPWEDVLDAMAVGELLEAGRRLQARRRAVDRRVVGKLRWLLRQSGRTVSEWADRLAVPPAILESVLGGATAPDAAFWEAVRAYFEPLRKEPGDG